MLDLLNKTQTETETAISTATKRERIEAELRADASRSDRKIAEIVGCDHKTVGAARDRLGNSISPARSTGDQVAASKSRVTEFIGRTICPPPPGVIDEPKYDPFAVNCPDIVVPAQPAIAVYENTSGAVVITQDSSDYEGDNPIIVVRPENVEALLRRIRQVAADIAAEAGR